MLKVNVVLDLEELEGLEKVELNGETYYKLDNISLEKSITKAVNNYIVNAIQEDLEPGFDCDRNNSIIKNAILEHKDEIIEKVVNKVSQSVLNSKQIKKLKKEEERC